jgi:DNA mismatch repair protein MSH6
LRSKLFAGKFYEMFHMDADAGVEVCGLTYMKGANAHAGFPEISYGTMADKLVRAGYKVARVEQTETPEQLKDRKVKAQRGKAPKVVNREVCSVMTMGTRTFCYLDDSPDVLDEASGGDASIGPLLAIREILLEQSFAGESELEDDENVQPVCEYGITLVDAVRGSVTIGQFADDVLRSRMVTMLATFSPSEVSLT